MGSYLWAKIATWTFFVTVLLKFVGAEQGLLIQELGLRALPDIAKINISLDEYTRTMTRYLEMKKKSDSSPIPSLFTFEAETKSDWGSESSSRLKFPLNREVVKGMEVESAELRLLAPPNPNQRVQLEVYQILSPRRRRFLRQRTLYLSKENTKWCDLDITDAVKSWLDGETLDLDLELVCLECLAVEPRFAAITALAHPKRREKRSSPYQSERKTDCRKKGKKRCCRHQMHVEFEELNFPEMHLILHPKSYEAGFCQGHCPPKFNHATNHSRIQSLVHQLNRSKMKGHKNSIIPKACCAPSKLKPLEIMRVSSTDPTKLTVEKWENMEVVDCACS